MKIYKIEFNNIWSGSFLVENKNHEKLDISKYGIVAKESDLEFLSKFGDGFKTIELIGELFEYDKAIAYGKNDLLIKLKPFDDCLTTINLGNVTINKDTDFNNLANKIIEAIKPGKGVTY